MVRENESTTKCVNRERQREKKRERERKNVDERVVHQVHAVNSLSLPRGYFLDGEETRAGLSYAIKF